MLQMRTIKMRKSLRKELSEVQKEMNPAPGKTFVTISETIARLMDFYKYNHSRFDQEVLGLQKEVLQGEKVTISLNIDVYDLLKSLSLQEDDAKIMRSMRNMISKMIYVYKRARKIDF